MVCVMPWTSDFATIEDSQMDDVLIRVKDLKAAFRIDGKMVNVIEDISFDIKKGEILGIAGESGSGKSVTSKCIMQLISDPGKITGGQILLDSGEDVLKYNEKQRRSYRGSKVSMIFQEPMTSLNPVFTCKDQIMEAIQLHQKVSKKEAEARTLEMLKLVGIPSPELRMNCYPFELSGGMRQRMMIAMALCCNPELLIADEPTTALDPTIEAQILDLIRTIQADRKMSVLFITHDLAVIAELCHRVIIMYAGHIMEMAPVEEIFEHPMHPYTHGLMKAIPKIDEDLEWLYNIKGRVPSLTEIPAGCVFNNRCPYATDKCRNERPSLEERSPGHKVSCWKTLEEGGGF